MQKTRVPIELPAMKWTVLKACVLSLLLPVCERSHHTTTVCTDLSDFPESLHSQPLRVHCLLPVRMYIRCVHSSDIVISIQPQRHNYRAEQSSK